MTTEEKQTREPDQLPMAPSEVKNVAIAELDRLAATVQDLSIFMTRTDS